MRNIEKLRDYFLGKDPQLKETLSDNSLRLIGIEGKHFVLRTELLKRLTELRKHVDDKDEELQDNIDAEAEARSQLADNVYTKAQVDALIDLIPKFDIEIVESLPTQDISDTTIYLVPSQDPEAGSSYDEYIYINNNWELIGTTNIDLSDYYTKSEVNTITSMLQGKLTAGDNITISDENEISSTDTTYDNFVGTTGIENGEAGLVPAPQTSDMGKYLKADGTWSNISGTPITLITDSEIRLYGMSEGLYYMPSYTKIYYNGATSTADFLSGVSGIMMIYKPSPSDIYTQFHIWGTQNGAIDRIINGYFDQYSGSYGYCPTEANTTISSASTDNQVPTAKAVYDYVDTMITQAIGGSY